jgi:hypothetical protein
MKTFLSVVSQLLSCAFVFGAANSISAQTLASATSRPASPKSHAQVASTGFLSKQPNATSAPATPVELAYPLVAGNNAILRNGIAYAPSNAPVCVKSAIWAVNTICRKPFLFGGGHRSFSAVGYDCSGTVSFALHHAGGLKEPLVARDLMRYGDPGPGRWITVLAKREHTYILIAGLRLDTTDFRYGSHAGPRWHGYLRLGRGFEVRHPVGL